LNKCPICGAELAKDMPFCPICGASLGFPFRPLLFGLVFLAICEAALHFLPAPYSYIAAVLSGVVALFPLSLTAFILYRRLAG
jgi:hypothetical protein